MFTRTTFFPSLARSKAQMPAVILLILLSMSTGTVATALCPHMTGAGASCLVNETAPVAPAKVSEPSHTCMHSDMSGMDMDEMAAADKQEAGPPPSDETGFSDEPTLGSFGSHATAEAMAQTDDDCVHCMMHSQNIPATSFRHAVQLGDSHEVTAVDSSVERFNSLPGLSIFDVHDHGPPGARGARHLLINVFRI